MDNDIDRREYYISYHIIGRFDCCWVVPRIQIPKDLGRRILKGEEYAEQVVIDMVADHEEVPTNKVQIFRMNVLTPHEYEVRM